MNYKIDKEGIMTYPPEPSGRRLRTIMEEKFPDHSVITGVSCGLWVFDYPCNIIIDREFQYIVPENDFKQWVIHPNNSEWNFDNANKWIEYINKTNKILRMHCPIGPQVSDWAIDDNRTADELEKNMCDFLIAICKSFNNSKNVIYMDVVNETVHKGVWFGPKPGSGIDGWENPWPRMGLDSDINHTPLYIKKAFQITNQYAPNIKQLYNHHEGPENTESWNLIKDTIQYLKNDGYRVDAIGWQAHVDNGWAIPSHLQALKDIIDWTQENNMEFHVTEASSFINNDVNEHELNLQAETYSKIFDIILEKNNTGKVGWNLWHLTDACTYMGEYLPALFDKNSKAKPAYYAIQKSLEEYNK